MKNMFEFGITITGSATGEVKANSIAEAKRLIFGGQWDDIDIDVDNVVSIDGIWIKNKRGDE